MSVKRIVSDISSLDPELGHEFYGAFLELDLVMDQGWIRTYASKSDAPVQISIAAHGGSGTQTPDLSIEVEDVDTYYQRAIALGYDIIYPLTDEPWQVRRFYVRDPFGKVINILSHTG